jgi:transcriptional regulator with XRE-family HTH domain
MKSQIANNLQNLLDQRNLTSATLEKAAGLKPQTIWNIISGRSKNPKMETLQKAASALNCSVEDLLSINQHENLSVSNNDKVNLILDEELFHNSCQAVLKQLKQVNLKISLKQLLSFIEQVYEYSAGKQDHLHQPDIRFTEWIVQMYLKKR